MPFEKEVIFSLPIEEEWTRYLVPFQSNNTYAVDALAWGFHLATQTQTIELGGFTAINFSNSADLEDLPNEVNNEQYDGYELDAPWRADAANRIEQLRKANLTINLEDVNGNPVQDGAVNVKMLQHDFGFGTAVTAARLPGANGYNPTYANNLINLDGEGHGFNCVVFENDLIESEF